MSKERRMLLINDKKRTVKLMLDNAQDEYFRGDLETAIVTLSQAIDAMARILAHDRFMESDEMKAWLEANPTDQRTAEPLEPQPNLLDRSPPGIGHSY